MKQITLSTSTADCVGFHNIYMDICVYMYTHTYTHIYRYTVGTPQHELSKKLLIKNALSTVPF